MTTISAKSILASRHAVSGHTLHAVLTRYPRFIHAELMTHRVFSRNAASSRAIPVWKLIRDVLADPAVPIQWGSNKPGMQAGAEVAPWKRWIAKRLWLTGMYVAVALVALLHLLGLHKQICNRLLEPWSHITVLISGTQWSNFLHLRVHKDAEPHMQVLAREIQKALDGASVQVLQPGEWHLPFASTDADDEQIFDAQEMANDTREIYPDVMRKYKLRLSVARCASTSYKTVDGFDMTLERAVALHDKLVAQDPLHASPCEHVAQADGWGSVANSAAHNGSYNLAALTPKWDHPDQHGNFTGFRQYRKMLPGECR
jgi:hypothetical protein